MRTKTIELTLYKFSELSDEAKQRAKSDYFSDFGYNWSDESLESLKALCNKFGVTLKDYEIAWDNSCYSYARFDCPEMEIEEIDSILASLGTFNPETLKGNGDCKLTGYAMDESLLDGFRIERMKHGEADLEKLMQAAFKSWLKDCQADYEYQQSDEAFEETCEANEWEFSEKGKLVK